MSADPTAVDLVRAIRLIASAAAIPDGWRETLLAGAEALEKTIERKTLAPDTLRELLTISPLDLHNSAIEAHDDIQINGFSRPVAIDVQRRYLRRAYRFGAAELLAKLVERDLILVELQDIARIAEIIRNRGTTDEAKRQ